MNIVNTYMLCMRHDVETTTSLLTCAPETTNVAFLDAEAYREILTSLSHELITHMPTFFKF